VFELAAALVGELVFGVGFERLAAGLVDSAGTVEFEIVEPAPEPAVAEVAFERARSSEHSVWEY
jgi:hypothetical protein